MKHIKLPIVLYFIFFFLSFQILHESCLFDNCHSRNIIIINHSDISLKNINEIEDSCECPLCKYIASISLFVSTKITFTTENIQYENIYERKISYQIKSYNLICNKSPPFPVSYLAA